MDPLALRLPVHDEPWIECPVCVGRGWVDTCGHKMERYSGEGGACCGACKDEPCRWCREEGVVPARIYDTTYEDEMVTIGALSR
jgi:hypothetical protein